MCRRSTALAERLTVMVARPTDDIFVVKTRIISDITAANKIT